jgi:DNA helicase II / ATP-dependent DNA helicase PcrA
MNWPDGSLVRNADPSYARLMLQAIALMFGRHASEREKQDLSAELMALLNASIGSSETTHA